MSRDIEESDWKLMRKLHPIALERFCQRVLAEIESISRDSAKSSHQRYLEIFGVIKRRDEQIAEMFNNPRRSTAIRRLAAMRSHELVTEEEFAAFSPEVRSVVAILLGGAK
jgi:ABC-type histidine transport system ATPase subunit